MKSPPAIYSDLLGSILNVSKPVPGVNRPAPGGADPKPVRRIEPLNIPAQMRFISNPKLVVQVKIRHLGSGFLSLLSPKPVLVDTRVQLDFNERALEAKASSCLQQPDGYLVEASFQEMAFVRRELRVPVDFTAELTVEGQQPVRVRVVDMSPSGLGLVLPMELEIGTGVLVDFGSRKVYGEVRYCRQSAGCYRAGLSVRETVSRAVAAK